MEANSCGQDAVLYIVLIQKERIIWEQLLKYSKQAY
jgi:hypothetical protein